MAEPKLPEPTTPKAALVGDCWSLRHGRVDVSVPADWVDHTTTVLMGPPTRGPALRLGGGKSPGYRPTLGVSCEVPKPADQTPGGYLQTLSQDMAAGPLDSEVLETRELVGGSWLLVRRAQLEGLVLRQLTRVIFAAEMTVVATLSILQDSDPETEKAAIELLLGVEIAQSGAI